MNKNDEILDVLDHLMQYLPENILEEKPKLMEKVNNVYDRLNNKIYVCSLDIDKVFYRLNNRFSE